MLVNDIVIIESGQDIETMFRLAHVMSASAIPVYLEDGRMKFLILNIIQGRPIGALEDTFGHDVTLHDPNFLSALNTLNLEKLFAKNFRLRPHDSTTFGQFITGIKAN